MGADVFPYEYLCTKYFMKKSVGRFCVIYYYLYIYYWR